MAVSVSLVPKVSLGRPIYIYVKSDTVTISNNGSGEHHQFVE